MRIERICKACGKTFFAKKLKQWHCSRKCFKQNYFKKSKDKPGVYPKFVCEVCKSITYLRIDPTKDEFFWTNFKCPVCNPKLKRRLSIIKTSKNIFVAF